MPYFVTITCPVCGKQVDKPKGEYNRRVRLGKVMYCSNSCGAKVSNAKIRAKEVVRECPVCGVKFVSSTKKRGAVFCSRGCASRGSVTEYRYNRAVKTGKRNVKNLCTPTDALKKREAWKYILLKKHLQDRPHEFEFQLGKWVFDLALLDINVLVEFDGIYHRSSQLKIDAEKDTYANENGFLVVRRATEVCCVLDPAVLEGL